MGSFVGSVVFSASAFFYCLGLIFAVVGYIGAWLEPRYGAKQGIEMISISTACFIKDGFQFTNIDSRNPQDTFEGCYDTTKTSEKFQELPPKNVSPGW